MDRDLNEIAKLGSNAIPRTNEGKIHYMMNLLEIFLANNELEKVANIYLKLKDKRFLLNTQLKNKFSNLIDKMNNAIKTQNLVNLQFTKFYNQMPPLNEKGFNKFDSWQVDTINNINNNRSTIICAPTSAGKSVISGYVVTKGKALYVVPTDALAWQVSSYIGGIINSDIPIITLTYQSVPKRDQFIKLLNHSNAIVGTPECILDYLPFINCDFKWVIFDEIHMMGKKESYPMETIAKVLCKIPFLALSATIGNVNDLKLWFEKIGNKNVEVISCNKRFFNLQKYYYNKNDNDLVMLNPLSLVSYLDFEDGTILNKTLNPTPQDTWSLVTKLLDNKIDLGVLDPYSYFGSDELIELTKTYEYFRGLLKFMVDNYDNYKDIIQKILNEYTSLNFNNCDINSVELIDTLKNTNKFPAIIFQQNTISCLEMVKVLANDLENREMQKYNNLRKDRMAQEKNNKKLNKKLEKELTSLNDKKVDKKMKENKDFAINLKIQTDEISDKLILIASEDVVNAPHIDFIYNKDDRFTDNEIKEWADKFKVYFPCINGDYHYLIKLLWRGIGVYANGLPDSYLRLIQILASKKKLAVVFSDVSLVFGISMPFRSAVIYKNNSTDDNLDAMMYHQMAGRAGRRGLDKEGNVIFVGYSWDRVKELSISSIPIINGSNKLIWSLQHANMISSNNNYLTVNKNLFDPKYNIENINSFDNLLNTNYKNIWNFSIEEDKNMIQLLWMFRYSNEGIILCYLLPYLKKQYEICNPNDESKQIEIAYFLSKFIDIHEPNTLEDTIPDVVTLKIDYIKMYSELNDLDIVISPYIDGKVWLSIRNNLLLEQKNEILRQRLFDFSTKLKALQHYCYHTKQVNLTKLLGKTLTRIWWIYHQASMLRNNVTYRTI